MATTVVAIIGLAGVALTALVTYLVSARRFSGEIESSEASELWKESRSIRDWSKARIEALEKENHELRERVAVLEAKIGDLTGDDAPNWLS